MNDRGTGTCFIIGNFEFYVINYVAIGYIILMVSVRACLPLFSWQSLRNDGQHLALNYAERTSLPARSVRTLVAYVARL